MGQNYSNSLKESLDKKHENQNANGSQESARTFPLNQSPSHNNTEDNGGRDGKVAKTHTANRNLNQSVNEKGKRRKAQ